MSYRTSTLAWLALLATASVPAVLASATAPDAQAGSGTLPELHDALLRQEHAMGDLGALKSIALNLELIEPDARYDLTVRILRPDRMRVDLRVLGYSVYSEGLGSRGPWQQKLLQRAPERTSAAGGLAIENGLEGSPWARSLREMHRRGHAVTLLPFASAREIGLRVEFRNGTVRDYFLDRASFRVARTVQTFALHPDIEGPAQRVRRFESRFSDYRKVEGYMLPMRVESRDLDSGRIEQSTNVRQLAINPALDARVFEAR